MCLVIVLRFAETTEDCLRKNDWFLNVTDLILMVIGKRVELRNNAQQFIFLCVCVCVCVCSVGFAIETLKLFGTRKRESCSSSSVWIKERAMSGLEYNTLIS